MVQSEAGPVQPLSVLAQVEEGADEAEPALVSWGGVTVSQHMIPELSIFVD